MFASKDVFLTPPSGGYTISRSVRLRSSASGYLNRTFGTPTNALKWTWSGWVKRGILGTNGTLISGVTSGSVYTELRFNSTDVLRFHQENGATTISQIDTVAVFRDPSAWYHIVLVYDSANATSANRLLIYVNGVSQTLTTSVAVPLNQASNINQASEPTQIGNNTAGPLPFDGYLTEINFIDGQALTPSSFGSTNALTGVWQPAKYTGTYGTNGFYLNFSDNSNNTATTIGKDYSGNGNNWTPNNISVTAGATYDSMVDSPTVSSLSSNYCVLNPLDAQGTATLSDANLTLASATTAHKNRKATFLLPSTGKWYWELTTASTCSATVILGWGLQTTSAASDSQAGNANTWMAQNDANQDIFNQTTSVLSTGSAVSGGSIRQVAYDADTGKLWFGINNTWYSSTDLTSGNPSAGTNQCMTLSAGDYFPAITCYNLTANANFGQRPFTYTPPTGFVALNTYNLPASTITNGAKYMDVSLWTGTSATQTITNGGFYPDFLWIKSRSAATDHTNFDSVRGTNKVINTDLTAAEYTPTANTGLSSFNSNGFTLYATDVSGAGSTNFSPRTYVGWQWNPGSGSSSSNANGSITSTVSAGATQGFSVVTYTGNGVSSATVGHGLGVTPSMLIIKTRTGGVENWCVWHQSLGASNYFLRLNATDAVNTSLNNRLTGQSSTTFTLGNPSNTETNGSGYTYVAYCFSAVKGFSAFGSYTGNGSADGPFVYLGFRPRWVMIKRTDSSPYNWVIGDTSRNTYNVANAQLSANLSDAENTSYMLIDFVSNGFKLRTTDGAYNASGGTYIYAVFAEVPFKVANAR